MNAARRNAVLGAVALALAALWFGVLEPRRVARRAEREAAVRLAPFDPFAVDALVLERPADTLRFVVRGTHWELVAPVHDLAEPGRVERLLGALADATARRILRDPAAPGTYGLATDAAIRVVATEGDDTVACVALGRRTVERDAVYARRCGRRAVWIVPTDTRRYAETAIEDFRSRRIARFDRSLVRAWTLARDGDTLRCVRRGPHDWAIVDGPDTLDADPDSAQVPLRRLRGWRALAFVDDPDVVRAVLASPTWIRVERDPPAPAIVVHAWLPPRGAARTAVEGQARVVEVQRADVAALLATRRASVRDRRLLRADFSRAVRLEYADADTTVTLVRSGRRWEPPNPTWGAVDPDRMAALVRRLRALRWEPPAEDLAPGSEPGEGVLRGDALRLVLYGGNGRVLDAFELLDDGGVDLGARTRRAGVRARVGREAARRLRALVRRLRPADDR